MTDIVEIDLSHAGRRVAGHGLDAWFAEARELMKLAGPLIFTQVAQMAIMTTDVIMLGRVGQTTLASAALGITAPTTPSGTAIASEMLTAGLRRIALPVQLAFILG